MSKFGNNIDDEIFVDRRMHTNGGNATGIGALSIDD